MNMDEEKITQEQIISTICLLAVRMGRLEDLLTEFINAYSEQDGFITHSVLKSEMERLKQFRKVTTANRYMNKRITELDKSFKGFLSYFHQDKLAPKKGEKEIDEPF